MKVKDLLKSKGLEVIAVDSEATVDVAITKMLERNIGAVLVMKDAEFVGVFTERDVVRCWERAPFDKVKIEDVMSKDIIVVTPEDELDYVMTIMITKRIRHLPVVDHGRTVGLISMRDVVRSLVGNLKAEVHYLKDYITGKYL